MPSLESWLAAMPSLQTFGPVGSYLHPLQAPSSAPLATPPAACTRLRAPWLCLAVAVWSPGHGLLDESFP